MILLRESWKDSLVKAVQQTTDAVAFARAWLDWQPHEGQQRWLLAPERPTAVLVTGRRYGKSECAAIQALYYAVFRPKTRQGIVSVTLDQARLSFDVALMMCQRQPLLAALVDKVRETPFPLLRFKHGSEITVRTAAREGIYLRGHKFHRCIVDEADYLSERLINEVVRMTLADVAGQLVLITTPRARRGMPPDPKKRFVCGADLAKSEDYTVLTVLDATQKPYRLAHFERFQRLPWPAVAARIREVHQRYSCHQTLIDATGVGDAVLDEVRDVAQGYVFTQRSKLDLLTNLQVALEKRELQFPFVRELVDELQGYSFDDKSLTTDCVMSLALAVWAAGPRATVQWAPSIWG